MGKNKAARSSSPPPQDLEEVDQGDTGPESRASRAGRRGTNKEPKARGKKKKAEAEPEVEEDADDDQDDDAAAGQIDWEAIREWVVEFRSKERRLPNATEIMEVDPENIDEALAKKVAKKVKSEADAKSNRKKSQKVRGYHALAKEGGWGVDGRDTMHPAISMPDTTRLATFQAYTPDAVSFTEEEFAAREELCATTVSQSVAREITSWIDPVFQSIMSEGVMRQLTTGGTRLTPFTMYQVLAPMASQLPFKDVLMPPGLVKFTKDEAPPARNQFDAGSAGLEGWKKATTAFKKKVPYSERGSGLVEVEADDDDEKALAKENKKAAKANGVLYTKNRGEMTAEKDKKRAARAEALSKKQKGAA